MAPLAISQRPSPRPVYFGPAEAPLLGWYHGSEQPAACAVLLCAPWGDEDLAVYRGLHELANCLARAGLPVLRFDLAGEGDSFDLAAPGEPDRWDAWRASVEAAADLLRECSGAPRLALLGVRLGALLAAHVAVARDDVAALVGLLPPASGRAWVREARLAGANVSPAARRDGTLQAGGFEMNAATVERVNGMAWPIGGRTLPHALLLDRSELPLPPATLAAWRALAGEFEHQRRDDLGEVLAIAHSARLPAQAQQSIADWLRQVTAGPALQGGVLPTSPVPRVAWPPAEAAAQGLQESVVQINCGSCGSDGAHGIDSSGSTGNAGATNATNATNATSATSAMVGVLSRPLAPSLRGMPALLLLSSGAERRIGPHRLWVPLARQRARAGELVLRLDLPGLGDSPQRAGEGEPDIYDARCAREIADAVEWLKREHGAGPVTVMGICSGAYHAWQAVRAAAQVDAVVSVNPLVFHWQAGMSLDPSAHAFGQIGIASDAVRSVRDPRRWLKLMRGRVRVRVILAALLGRMMGALKTRLAAMFRSLGGRLRHDLAHELLQATRRGVAVHFVFAAGEPGRVLLEREAGARLERLSRDGRVQLTTVERADHTFMQQTGRQNFYNRLHPLLDAVAHRAEPAGAAHPSVVVSS